MKKKKNSERKTVPKLWSGHATRRRIINVFNTIGPERLDLEAKCKHRDSKMVLGKNGIPLFKD